MGSSQQLVKSSAVAKFVLLILLIKDAKGMQPAPIKTIKTVHGDVFDCIDIYEQPGLKHPLLKDHKVQLKPTSYPDVGTTSTASTRISSANVELDDGGCPQGSVPVMRIATANSSSTNMEIMYRALFAQSRTRSGVYYGGSAALNIFGLPMVQSLQISGSLVTVARYGEPWIALHGGWMVWPKLWGDTRTRLFFQWTTDGGLSNCRVGECPGFVQVNPKIGMGGAVSPLGEAWALPTFIYMDQVTGNWWVAYVDMNEPVGYLPKEVLKGLNRATEVSYGGFVSCPDGVPCPPMGNGVFPPDLQHKDNNACYVMNPRFVDHTRFWATLDPLHDESSYVTNPGCYRVGIYRNNYTTGQPFFRFGGPGC